MITFANNYSIPYLYYINFDPIRSYEIKITIRQSLRINLYKSE